MFRLLYFLPALFLACQPEPQLTPDPEPVVDAPAICYLALGDSYTIGQSVPEEERYPVQFANRLRAEDIEIEDPRIIAVTGWTTANLKNGIASAELDSTYDLVSLLIGVNNQFQGKSIEEYEIEFDQLLDSALYYAGGDPEKVFVLSIPDYAYTPFGQSRPNPEMISAELDAFNAINQTLTEARDILYFNITPISRFGLEQPELVASDNLHPSGEQYRRWVEVFYEAVKARL